MDVGLPSVWRVCRALVAFLTLGVSLARVALLYWLKTMGYSLCRTAQPTASR